MAAISHITNSCASQWPDHDDILTAYWKLILLKAQKMVAQPYLWALIADVAEALLDKACVREAVDEPLLQSDRSATEDAVWELECAVASAGLMRAMSAAWAPTGDVRFEDGKQGLRSSCSEGLVPNRGKYRPAAGRIIGLSGLVKATIIL